MTFDGRGASVIVVGTDVDRLLFANKTDVSETGVALVPENIPEVITIIKVKTILRGTKFIISVLRYTGSVALAIKKI
jgi:hypothetical protein